MSTNIGIATPFGDLLKKSINHEQSDYIFLFNEYISLKLGAQLNNNFDFGISYYRNFFGRNILLSCPNNNCTSFFNNSSPSDYGVSFHSMNLFLGKKTMLNKKIEANLGGTFGYLSLDKSSIESRDGIIRSEKANTFNLGVEGNIRRNFGKNFYLGIKTAVNYAPLKYKSTYYEPTGTSRQFTSKVNAFWYSLGFTIGIKFLYFNKTADHN
ncbi:MAG: hypothetical protein AB8B61_08670 [Cyclobacteriaceae bacterium]